MPTARKRSTVKDLQKLYTNSSVLIFTDYRGLSVSEITSLRRQLRDKGVEYHVTKNTLSNLAATKAGMEAMAPMLDGPTAIAFVGDDIAGAAKVLSDFVRTSKILQIRGGLAGRTVLNEYQVGDLTKILSREQYIAKILGSMNSPVSSMVNVLSGTIRSFMNVMQARVDQLKEQEGAAGEAEAGEAQAPTQEVAAPEAPTAEAAPTEAGPAAGTEPTPVEASIEDAPSGEAPDVATSATEAGPGTGDATEGDAAAADAEEGSGEDASTEGVEG